MQIIWNKEAAEQLRGNQTVLELETIAVNGELLTSYCVVPAEKILSEMAQLENLTMLHADFIKKLNEHNYPACCDIVPGLLGKFGGELDSFYEFIVDKINNDQSGN